MSCLVLTSWKTQRAARLTELLRREPVRPCLRARRRSLAGLFCRPRVTLILKSLLERLGRLVAQKMLKSLLEERPWRSPESSRTQIRVWLQRWRNPDLEGFQGQTGGGAQEQQSLRAEPPPGVSKQTAHLHF